MLSPNQASDTTSTAVNLDTAFTGEFAGSGDWYLQYCEEARYDRAQAQKKTAPVVGSLAMPEVETV